MKLDLVMEKLTGQPFDDAAKAHILSLSLLGLSYSLVFAQSSNALDSINLLRHLF